MGVRTATGLIAAYMRLCGFSGWTSFWNVIYVLPGTEHDERLLRHMNGISNPVLYERKHLEQIEGTEALPLFLARRSDGVLDQVPVVAVSLCCSVCFPLCKFVLF